MPRRSMVSPTMAALLLVRTTRFTEGVRFADSSTLRVPSRAGSTSSFCGSFTAVVKGEAV